MIRVEFRLWKQVAKSSCSGQFVLSSLPTGITTCWVATSQSSDTFEKWTEVKSEDKWTQFTVPGLRWTFIWKRGWRGRATFFPFSSFPPTWSFDSQPVAYKFGPRERGEEGHWYWRISCKCKQPKKILETQWKNQIREEKAVTKKSCWTW